MALEVRFSELRRLLEQNGWRLTRIKGSHHTFVGEGRPSIPIPVHKNRVKAVYLKQVEQAIRALQADKEGERDQERRSL